MRPKVLVPTAAALLALTLAGCAAPAPSADPNAQASAAPSAVPSAAEPSTDASPSAPARAPLTPINTIDGITVGGEFGKLPTVTFTAPFAIDETRSKVLIPGTGAPLSETASVDIHYHGVNAYTGESFDSSYADGKSRQFTLDGVVPGFKKGLVGKHVGDRVLVVIPGKDGYDAQGGSGEKIQVGDTLIFVIDIIDTDYPKPHGTAVTPAAGLPAVTADANGVPNVAINTAAAAPTATVVQPLIAGSSPRKVAATDHVMSHYRMWSWKTGQLIDDKFSAPSVAKLSDSLKCVQDGLVNQPLGSRVMLVCPPATGYPEGFPGKIEKGDTVVVIVDLMDAATI